jgi:hypothetical protein
MHYLELLRHLHEELQPAGYLEIGVDWGDSLGLSRARSVAIDPAPKPRPETLLGKPGLVIYVGEPDDFFAEYDRAAMLGGTRLDLAFIDGLHEFTQVVRDLENVERWGHPGTVVAIHDVLPRNAWEAAPAFHDGFWTGDVWRIVPFLRAHRPDLRLWLTEADPTGMLIVSGLDPAHPGMAHLAEAENAVSPPVGPDYDRLVEGFIADAVAVPAEEVIRALGVERRLEWDWAYETKWGMRIVAESSWRPLLDASAALPHTNQHRAGLRACLRLIGAHWLPEDVREQAYGHLGSYADSLTSLWPEATWQPLTIPGDTTSEMRSPSLASLADGLVVTVETPAGREETAWALLALDRDLHVREVTPLTDGTRAATAPLAIERMHPVLHDGRLHALITFCDRTARGVAQTGLVTVQDGALRDLRLLSGQANGCQVTPWAPVLVDDSLRAVSWWEPTETQQIDAATGETRRVSLHPAPRLAERFRDASAGVPVPGGWLFLGNEPAPPSGDDGMVFARFVFTRSDFVVTAVSPHFWVTARGEDSVSGLTRDGGDLIAGFTSRGKEALLVRIPLHGVLTSLLRVESAGLAIADVGSA